MRFRTLLLLVLLALAGRSAMGCALPAGPGDKCQGGGFIRYSCPDGYTCNDGNEWTCTKDRSDAPPPYPSSSTTANPSSSASAGLPPWIPISDPDDPPDAGSGYGPDAGNDAALPDVLDAGSPPP